MRRFHCLTVLAAAAVFVPVEAQAQQLRESRPAAAREAPLRPKITQDAARSIALARVPHGTVAAVDLKTEKGVLSYIYDIAVPGKDGLEEIQISAVDGQVLSVRHLGGSGGQSANVADRAVTPEPPR